MSETKKLYQDNDRKYLSLSDILSEKSSSPVKEPSITKVSASDLNELLTVQELFEELQLDCDEQIKKLDEMENKRKENYNNQIKILKMIKTDLVFKNRQLIHVKKLRKLLTKNNLKSKLKRKISKKRKIKIKSFELIKNLVKINPLFKYVSKMNQSISDYSFTSSTSSSLILRRTNLKSSIKHDWNKERFKKKDYRNVSLNIVLK